jgi:hypothetical protein
MEAKDFITLHHDDSEWYICLAEKQGDKWHQKMYHISKIRQMSNDDPRFIGKDKYFSLNSFYRPSRKSEDVRHIRALYVDIDCYKVGLEPHEVAYKLQNEYFEKKIPTPNVITFTGRGINCIWWIEHAPKGATKSWKRMNSYLYEQLKPLGADSSSVDLSRVFRIPGSINSKSNQKVQAFIRKRDKYRLGELLEQYAPWNKEKREKQEKKVVKKKWTFRRKFTLKTLAQARIKDLETLQHLRNQNGVVDGYREVACFLYYYNKLCLMLNEDRKNEDRENEERAFQDVLEYNKRFIKPLDEKELQSIRKYTEEKAKEWKIAYNLKEFKLRKDGEINLHGLIFSNKRLIELLDITEDEQKFMLTIIGEEEKKRRERIRQANARREKGQVERQEYLKAQKQITEDKLNKLKQLLEANPLAKRQELAEMLGVSVYRVDKLKKQLKERCK